MSSFPSQAQQTVTVLGTKYNLDVLEGLEEKVQKNNITNQKLWSE